MICEMSSEWTEGVTKISKDVVEDIDIYHFCLISSKIGHGEWRGCQCSSSHEEFREGAIFPVNGRIDAPANIVRRNTVSNNRLAEIGGECIQFMSSEGDLTESPLLLGMEDIVVMENFVTESEEAFLRKEIYKLPWKLSQSGRRKQVMKLLT